MKCRQCGEPIDALDVALTKKLINRGIEHFWCKKCLSMHFELSEAYLLEKAKEYQQQGCMLFEGLEIDLSHMNS